MKEEARLEDYGSGLAPGTEGWFVVNTRDAAWLTHDEGLLEFRRGRGISVAGTPERGVVVQRARELVEFARTQGYRVDELVEIIEDVV